MKALLIAAALIAVPANAFPESPSPTAIHRALKPWDIDMPPQRFRSTEGNPDVVFYNDPRDVCRQSEGMITLACTLGKRPNRVLTVMPMPSDFLDESFARDVAEALSEDRTMAAIGIEPMALKRIIVTGCAFPGQVYARLACHEVVGHQLGGWPENHPKR